MNAGNASGGSNAIYHWAKETILETMSFIEGSNIGAVLFVDKNGRPLGFVTDGDIRRSLLKGASLSDQINTLWNSDPCIVQDTMIMSDRYQILMDRTIKHLIVVDENNQNAKLQSLQELKAIHDINPRRCPVLLMAGGRGQRLMPLTANCPKPMVKINGVPLLELTLKNLIRQGFERFFISVLYLKEQIMDYFGDGSQLNVSITYIEEDIPRGTAGCLRLLPEIVDGNLIVMNSDLITDLEFRALLSFHDARKSAATMVVKEASHALDYGLVRTEGSSFLSLEEKPTQTYFINTGICAIHHSSLEHMPPEEFFTMPDLFDSLINCGKECSILELKGQWIDIGNKEQFEMAQKALKQDNISQ